MRLSFICPSNNPEIFNENLVKSLDRQKNRDFELILVDTRKEHYSSAAAALNAGAARASGEYLVFLHHDIVLESDDFIDELLNMIDQNDFLIAGVAGAVRNGNRCVRRLRSNIFHGVGDRKRPAASTYYSDPVTEPIPVETLDECCFIISAEVFRKRPFPEFSATWHLYAVEYSLWAHEQDMENPVMLLPLHLWHLSPGSSMNQNYFTALHKLHKIYRKDIICSVGAWPAGFLRFEYRIMRRRIHLVKLWFLKRQEQRKLNK